MKTNKMFQGARAGLVLAGLLLCATRGAAQFTFTTNGTIITLAGVSNLQSVVTIPSFVANIGSFAFENDTALTSITIPNTVTNVSSGAFQNCYALAEVNIGLSVSNFPQGAFNSCFNLETINVTDGTTSIGNNAFANINSLRSVTIANSVTNIGASAFNDDYSLSSVSLGSNVVSIGSTAFAYCASLTSVAVPNSCTNIGSDAFQNCTSLTNITLGNGLVALQGGAFYQCSSLGSIVVPNSVVIFGGGDFMNCYSLSNLTIGPCVSNFSSFSVEGCYNLTTVTIAEGATSIGSGAFGGVMTLKTVVIPNSVTNIGSGAFQACVSLTNVSLGECVVSIGSDAFYECYELPAIRLPDSATNLGPSAFYDCSNLVSVSLGNRISVLTMSVFEACSSLRQIVLPATLTNLLDGAFQACSSLSNVYFQGNAPAPTNDSSVFFPTPATLYYFAGATGWGTNLDSRPTMALGAGAAQVTITPPQAVAEGAFWRVDNGADQASGATVNNLFPGPHVISFVPVGSLVTPASVTVNISSNQTALASGNYSGQGGSLQVTITPAGAVLAGATWQVDGGVDQISGALVTGITAGSHLVAFKPVSGWTPPPDQFVNVPVGGLGTAAGLYTAATSSTNGLVLLTNGAGTIKYKFSLDNLTIGNTYTVTAVPAAGNNFAAWLGGTVQPYATLATTPAYFFTMESNLVLEASFVTNIFPVTQGTYTGLFAPAGADRTQADSGAFAITVSKAGAVSGKLVIGSEADALSGKFGSDGAAQITAKRHNESTLTTSLQLDLANQAVEGTVTDGTFVASLLGYLNPFTAKNKAVDFGGKYTLIVPGVTNPAVGPAGAGYGTVTVSSTGAVSFAGSLADGTPVSQSSAISSNGYWPLYLTLYGGKGSFWGWNYFSNGTVNAFSADSWINQTNSSKTAALRAGFTNQQANLVGGVFVPASPALPGFTSGTVTLADGGQAFDIANPVRLLANNKIAATNAADTNKLSLTINKTTGAINGSFANPLDPTKKISVNGVLLQNETNAQGYFINNGQSGVFELQP